MAAARKTAAKSQQENKMNKRNAFYAQSGGVTAVINASACGVIETARRHRGVIGKVYAGRNGIIGALREELIDTSKESARTIAALRTTPSGAFGSCRHKLKSYDDGSARVPATDRRLQSARHRLLLLQRRWRLAGHREQGCAIQRAPRVSDHVHRDSENSRQRLAVHRHESRIRFGRQIRRRIDSRSGARCRQHVRDVDESFRDGGDGPARRLDRGGRGARPTVTERRAACDSVSGDRF